MAYGSNTSMENAKGKASEYADRAQEKLNEAGEMVSERAKQAGKAVRDYSDRAVEKVDESVREYPLATLAGAVAIGFVLGAILKR